MSVNSNAPSAPAVNASGGSITVNGHFVSYIALIVSFLALGLVFVAIERSRMAEREARIMEDDLKFVRAWVNARGYEIPINHEQAEEKSSVTPRHNQ